jgi:hypothetical protein
VLCSASLYRPALGKEYRLRLASSAAFESRSAASWACCLAAKALIFSRARSRLLLSCCLILARISYRAMSVDARSRSPSSYWEKHGLIGAFQTSQNHETACTFQGRGDIHQRYRDPRGACQGWSWSLNQTAGWPRSSEYVVQTDRPWAARMAQRTKPS